MVYEANPRQANSVVFSKRKSKKREKKGQGGPEFKRKRARTQKYERGEKKDCKTARGKGMRSVCPVHKNATCVRNEGTKGKEEKDEIAKRKKEKPNWPELYKLKEGELTSPGG